MAHRPFILRLRAGRVWGRGLAVALVWWMVGGAAGAEEAAAGRVRFVLRGPQARLVEGLEPRCFRVDAATGRLSKVDAEGKFSSGGSCELSLPPGPYRFEVLAAQAKENRLIALRSEVVEVDERRKQVDLPAAEPGRVRVWMDGVALRMREGAVRSLGDTGVARWTAEGGSSEGGPAIYAAKGDGMQLALTGSSERLSAIVWKRVRAATTMELRLGSAGMTSVELTMAPGGPRIASGMARFDFPDASVELPFRAGHRVVTGRREAAFGYELKAEDGRLLVVAPAHLRLEPRTVVELGGALRPAPWAFALWQDDGRFYPHWEAGLVDAAGREVRLGQSKIGFSATMRGRDGKPPAPGVLTKEEVKLWAEPEQNFVWDMRWTWGREERFSGPALALREMKSEHFVVRVPPPWTQRGENYLEQLERTHAAYRATSGRKGPRWTTVGWRQNTHNAKAQVGGETPWMSMPFQGLREAVNPYQNPWFMTHEMGHTFGYNHGAEMDAAIARTEAECERRRWAEVDAGVAD